MPENQVSALLARLTEDQGLRESLKGAPDIETFIVIAKEAGFDVSEADWLNHKDNSPQAISEGELEAIAGGNAQGGAYWTDCNICETGNYDPPPYLVS